MLPDWQDFLMKGEKPLSIPAFVLAQAKRKIVVVNTYSVNWENMSDCFSLFLTNLEWNIISVSVSMFSGVSWPTKRSSKSSGPVWHHSEKLGGGLALICLMDISSSQIRNTAAQTSRNTWNFCWIYKRSYISESTRNNHRVHIVLLIPILRRCPCIDPRRAIGGGSGGGFQFHLHRLESVSTSLKGPQPEWMPLTLLCSWRTNGSNFTSSFPGNSSLFASTSRLPCVVRCALTAT